MSGTCVHSRTGGAAGAVGAVGARTVGHGGAGAGAPWGRALRGELMKAVMLPSMWWTAAMTGAAGIAIIMSALQNSESGQSFGFEDIAPIWTLAVQIGFVTAGVIVAGAEHSSAQGMTSLLVTPVRGRLVAARLAVLTGGGLVAAGALVAMGVVACPRTSSAALWAGGRTVVWLTAALLLAEGIGEIVRSATGAATAAAVLVVLAPQLASILGDAVDWLPGQAGQIWVAGGASRDGVVTAGLIALAWTTAATAGGAARLVRADA